MESKQTAVEWILEQTMYIRSTKWPDIVEQALEMEKEQIEDAFQDGKWDWSEHIKKGSESKDLAQYYQETYGKRNAPSDEGIDQPEAYPEGGN